MRQRSGRLPDTSSRAGGHASRRTAPNAPSGRSAPRRRCRRPARTAGLAFRSAIQERRNSRLEVWVPGRGAASGPRGLPGQGGHAHRSHRADPARVWRDGWSPVDAAWSRCSGRVGRGWSSSGGHRTGDRGRQGGPVGFRGPGDSQAPRPRLTGCSRSRRQRGALRGAGSYRSRPARPAPVQGRRGKATVSETLTAGRRLPRIATQPNPVP